MLCLTSYKKDLNVLCFIPPKTQFGSPLPSLLKHVIFCNFMEWSIYILRSPWFGVEIFAAYLLQQVAFYVRDHSMARVNLNKSEELVTNTTVASKYIPKRSKICINRNPLSQTSLHKILKNGFLWSKSFFTTLTFRGNFTWFERGDFNWCRFWAS